MIFQVSRSALYAAAFFVFPLFLSNPAQAQSISELKTMLQAVGCYDGKIDETTSLKLRTAVRCFQKTNPAWTPDGQLTDEQRTQLAADVQSGKVIPKSEAPQVGMSREEVLEIQRRVSQFDPNLTFGTFEETTDAQSDLAYLAEGDHECLGMYEFKTVDAAACERIVRETLSMHGCSGSSDFSLEYCFDGDFGSPHLRAPIVKALKNYRKIKTSTKRIGELHADIRRRLFMIGDTPFEVPMAHERRSSLHTGFDLWSNLDPLDTCPDEIAYIVIDYKEKIYLKDVIKSVATQRHFARKISRTITQNTKYACRRPFSYELIVHAFFNGKYITTTAVPEFVVKQSDNGLATDFLVANMMPTFARQTQKLLLKLEEN